MCINAQEKFKNMHIYLDKTRAQMFNTDKSR